MEIIISTRNYYFTEEIFQRIEGGNVVVSFDMAKKLPRLKLNTTVYCLVDSYPNIKEYENVGKNIIRIVKDLNEIPQEKPIYILDLFQETINYVNNIYLISMNNDGFDRINNFVVTAEETSKDSCITKYSLVRTLDGEWEYLALLRKIISEGIPFGTPKSPQSPLCGPPSEVNEPPSEVNEPHGLSLFVEHMKFDLRNGFPLLTTKKMYIRYIIEDFLLFIKCNIDKLRNIIKLIKTNHHSRNIIMTKDPEDTQFYVQGDYIDMFCCNSSRDIFLVMPYNIALSAILLMVIAKITKKLPRYLKITIGDTHIYQDHIVRIKEQCKRLPYKFPVLNIQEIEDIEKCVISDFLLSGYSSLEQTNCSI